MTDLVVTSNVGRDLLQASQHFKSDRTVVWEYVANSLQYTNAGIPPEVVIAINERRKRITIADNGEGMRLSGLEHFFQMHGENLERAEGRIGRGMFGTGKSAAFGIADELVVATVRNGKKTRVRLHRNDVVRATDGDPIPIQVMESEVSTGEPNGTVIEISDIHLKKLDRAGVISYIERNLSHYPRDVSVFVDHHQCEFRQPDTAEEHSFEPEGDIARELGAGVQLYVRVAKGPLDEELRGIQVFSYANWHETTLAGAEGKPMSEYLFGEVDIPALEEFEGPIPPFDNTRSGRLNPENAIVAALYRFIGPNVDGVRRQLVTRERERARTEEARLLAQQAEKISEILSEDFAEFRMKLRRVSSAVTGRDMGKKFEPLAGDEEDTWTEGGEHPAVPAQTGDAQGEPGSGGTGDDQPPEFLKPVVPDPDGSTSGSPKGGDEPSKKRRPRGGLTIKYQNVGEGQSRGKYVLDTRTITINLDHPQVAAAYSLGGPDDISFLRFTAEIATSEYAIALATELAETYTIADEAIFDIHDTVDRISRRFADLCGST